ncbi:AraC family transcriptional regulator [uncultured Draconibacterium sp.]|uniref:AraC family transcriptional regulator n=1 Tax=uncultured Draconibacterium sp. TaxID=1573823 RepID=UPI0032615929
MKLCIKNKVCIRCQMVVEPELEKIGLPYNSVKIGEAEFIRNLESEQLKQLGLVLKKAGLLLMDDKKSILLEKVKSAIIDLVHYTEEQFKVNLSDFLSEKFYLTHKIERLKELFVNDELNLFEIAYKMHYCSVVRLSNKFRKFTGLNAPHFKKFKNKRRDTLDDV